jgi:hypothetical protein
MALDDLRRETAFAPREKGIGLVYRCACLVFFFFFLFCLPIFFALLFYEFIFLLLPPPFVSVSLAQFAVEERIDDEGKAGRASEGMNTYRELQASHNATPVTVRTAKQVPRPVRAL